jgi:hypothetical protein
MDNNDNDERIMEEIIAGGANAFASYTDEGFILNMIGQGGVTADDFANNKEDIVADSGIMTTLRMLMQKVPTRYTYHALSSLLLIR